jgi:hypothetical protein
VDSAKGIGYEKCGNHTHLLPSPYACFCLADNAGYGYAIEDSYAATILGTPQNLRADSRGYATTFSKVTTA